MDQLDRQVSNATLRMLVVCYGAIPYEIAGGSNEDSMLIGVALVVKENLDMTVVLTSRFTELDGLRLLRGYEKR